MSAYNNSTYALRRDERGYILAEAIDPGPATVTQTAGTAWFNSPQAVSDLDGYGWGGFNNPSLKLNFGAAKIVSTLVVATSAAAAARSLHTSRDDTGALIGNVQMAGGATANIPRLISSRGDHIVPDV